MNALQQIYDLIIENNKFLAVINEKLDALKQAWCLTIETEDNQHSEEDVEK